MEQLTFKNQLEFRSWLTEHARSEDGWLVFCKDGSIASIKAEEALRRPCALAGLTAGWRVWTAVSTASTLNSAGRTADGLPEAKSWRKSWRPAAG